MSIFVFGSNLAGIHGAGSAKHAVKYCGAILGQGIGPQGTSYAIPTKDADLQTLPLDMIEGYVDGFVEYAIAHPELRFEVVKIGCGLAGYNEAEIAPLFAFAPENVELPFGWRQGITLAFPSREEDNSHE